VLATLKNKTLGPSTKFIGTGASPRFSEIVGTVSAGTGNKFGTSAVQRKLQKKLGSAEPDFKVG